MSHVFISYSKKNRDYARRLADYLLASGFDIWIDDRIDFGSNWEREIFRAVDACAAIIVIMTPESYDSLWVQRERQYAENRHKQPFPLLLEGEAFPFYVVVQHYDVRGGKLPGSEFLEQLAEFAPRHTAALHSALDRAVLAAYGWDDLFETMRTDAGKDELLRRLLTLNHQRAAG